MQENLTLDNLIYNNDMTEENLPITHIEKKLSERKGKIPSKKEFMQRARDFIEINPEMDPQEVIRRTQRYQEDPNPNKSEFEREREAMALKFKKERLRRDGQNPSEWTYYGVGPQPEKGWNTEFTEEDMMRAHSRLPDNIELMVIQGHIAPASEPDRRNTGKEFYDMNHFWDMFIRIKSDAALEPPTPQLEEPK